MKIGIVATEFPPAVGGMEAHAAGLAEALSNDHDVTVFTKEEYATTEYQFPFPVKPIMSENMIADAKRLQPETVDFWLTLNAAYSVLSQLLDAPVFAYCHGNDFLKPWPNTLRTVESFICDYLRKLPYLWRFAAPLRLKIGHHRIYSGLANAQLLFVNSLYTKELLAKTFPKLQTSVEISHPGISNLFFCQPKETKQLSVYHRPTIRLLSIARLTSVTREKNIDKTLLALGLLKREVPFSYTIVGDGNIRNEFEALAAKLDISSQTTFTGTVDKQQVIEYLDASDLLILPSKETFGIVYAEAAARGVPSLACKIGGSAETVVDALTGIVIPRATPDEIARGVRRFERLKSSFDSAKMQSFAGKFHWHDIAQHTVKAIQLRLEQNQ